MGDVGEARGGSRPPRRQDEPLDEAGATSWNGVDALGRVHEHGIDRNRIDRYDEAPSAGVIGILRGASGPSVDCL